MRVIDQATNHYANQEKLIISVPEWETEIHVLPMTMAEINMIQSISKKNSSNIEQAANLIIIKARDAGGNRLFKLEDKAALMEKVDYKVIARIAEAIEKVLLTDVETQKGNLQRTQLGSGS